DSRGWRDCPGAGWNCDGSESPGGTRCLSGGRQIAKRAFLQRAFAFGKEESAFAQIVSRRRIPVKSVLMVFGSAQVFQLTLPIQLLNECLGFSPAGFDLNEQFQEDFLSQKRFQVDARGGPYLFEFLAPLADENRLLSLALAVNRSRDSR